MVCVALRELTVPCNLHKLHMAHYQVLLTYLLLCNILYSIQLPTYTIRILGTYRTGSRTLNTPDHKISRNIGT